MFEINNHELIFLENKRKSKTNSFIIFKLSDNNISLSNKKINISKKNNYIDVTSSDKNTLNKINNELKENLSNYISEHELDVKKNLTKVLFNDIITNNNKLYFSLGDEINNIDKTQKYNCIFNIPYIILIFTSNKISEVNLKIKLSSVGSEELNAEENETLGSIPENSSNSPNDEELEVDKCVEQVLSNNDNYNYNDNDNDNHNDNDKKKKNNKKQEKKIIKVDTEPELEEPIKKKRGRPRSSKK